MKALITKLIKIALGLLGVALVDSCIPKAEYGCPHADFEAKGVVTDEDGNGIQGIRVVISAEYPELNELFNQVKQSLQDLELHFQKEEDVLFPYLYKLFEASQNETYIEAMHCGTVSNPIRVMTMEHENERQRYMRLREITDIFRIPDDVCINYEQMMVELETFVEHLFEHIFIENNILFPLFEKLEREWVRCK